MSLKNSFKPKSEEEIDKIIEKYFQDWFTIPRYLKTYLNLNEKTVLAFDYICNQINSSPEESYLIRIPSVSYEIINNLSNTTYFNNYIKYKLRIHNSEFKHASIIKNYWAKVFSNHPNFNSAYVISKKNFKKIVYEYPYIVDLKHFI